jgi:hypothetical protein
MATTWSESRGALAADHETAREPVAVRSTIRRLQSCGLTLDEATSLAARLAGLRTVRSGWTAHQIEHLLFLRSIVETGRLGA